MTICLDTLNINGIAIVFETSASGGIANMEMMHSGLDCRATLEKAFIGNELKVALQTERRCPGRAYEKALAERKYQEKRQRIIKEILAEQAEAARKRRLEAAAEAAAQPPPVMKKHASKLGSRQAKAAQLSANKPYRKLKRRSPFDQRFDSLFEIPDVVLVSHPSTLAL